MDLQDLLAADVRVSAPAESKKKRIAPLQDPIGVVSNLAQPWAANPVSGAPERPPSTLLIFVSQPHTSSNGLAFG